MLFCRNLSYRYPNAAMPIAFPDLRLTQCEGLILHGASGSGKSTFLALLAGLIVAESGHLELAGVDPAKLSTRARDAWRGQKIGFLPQRLHLTPHLSVLENLQVAAFAAQPSLRSGQLNERIQEVLSELGIADLCDRCPANLSGGQTQRVALARALLLSPAVLLADEPSSHLDDEAASVSIGMFFRACIKRQTTWIIATHDLRIPTIAAQHNMRVQVQSLKRVSPLAMTRPDTP